MGLTLKAKLWVLGRRLAGSRLAGSSALGWQGASSYRVALKRMAGDLLCLRRRAASLEVENRQLRHSLTWQQELGQALLHDTDLDVMTREELLDRLGEWWARRRQRSPRGWHSWARWHGLFLQLASSTSWWPARQS